MSRVLAIIVAPFALAVLAPLALAFVVLFYIQAQMRALGALIAWAAFRRPAPPEPERKPHFLENTLGAAPRESASL